LARSASHYAAAPNTTAPAGPALSLDQLYFGTHPNYAISALPSVTVNSSGVVTGVTSGTGIRKFVDALPSLPQAVPDTITFPGSDYYEIELTQYSQKLHSDLPPTALRGYVQTNYGTDAHGKNTIAPPATPQYLGPLIIAQRNRPVRVKFTNMLPAGSGGDLILPVDTSVMGAGMNMNNGAPYQQNRANIHLHGGYTPWISDGTPNQWTVPKGDSAINQRGDSVQFVPDMFFDATGKVVPVPACSAIITTGCWPNAVPAGLSNDPGPGSLTMYYTNQQSARLMWYHDHAYGITRLNVYAGEASAYLLQDPVELNLVSTGIIPALQYALVIQDKTFVPPNPPSAPLYSVGVLEPGANYNQATTSVLFINGSCTTYPTAIATVANSSNGYGTIIPNAIVGITLTNPGSCSVAPDVVISDSAAAPGTGAAAFAALATLAQQDPTWMWGSGSPDTPTGNGDLWFPHTYMTNQWPDNPDGSTVNPMGRWDYGMWFWPPMTLSAPGLGGLVHASVPCATAVSPAQTCPGIPSPMLPATDPMSIGSIASLTPEAFMDTPLVNGAAYPKLTVPAGAVRLRILNASNDRSLNLSLFQADPTVTTVDGRKNTEVKMVTAAPTAGYPISWPTDGRDGGVPDPATAGPSWVQIGTEGGFIPNPVVIPPNPVNYEYARRSVTVTNVSYKSLYLGPAERADVIVDFSAYAGQTLILYNDAPAPTPAFDPRYDYYTDDPDQTAVGGAPTTLAGFGPNTRTVMQIVVSGAGTPLNLAGLQAQLPVAYKATQDAPLVPEAAYSSTFGQTFTNTYPKLQDYTETFTPYGATAPVTMTLIDKTIQELFELNYGRMNATLGTEIPLTNFTTQTTIPLGYVDPPTEFLKDSRALATQPVGVAGDGTQIWKITHNGVDTHAIHFHLFNVQLLNRIGWDGTNRPPDANELGWKETVRMNPLEIEFVALRPMRPHMPWPVPDSIRLIDVTQPAGFDPAMGLEGPTGGTATQQNSVMNFGWEYVWHCHLLGHEENDMMRPMIMQVVPPAPSNLAAVFNNVTGAVIVSWTDNSASETGFTLQRDLSPTFPAPVTILNNGNASVPSSAFGGTITQADSSAPAGTVYYRVRAVDGALTSPWTGPVSFSRLPVAAISPTLLAFGTVNVGSTGGPLPITLSNTGSATLAISSIRIAGTNAAEFKVTTSANACTATLLPGANCTINVTFTPTVTAQQTATLTVTDNSGNVAGSTQSVTLQGGKLSQTITFANPGTQAMGSGPYTLVATSTSGLTVTFASSTPAVCTVSVATATWVTAGTCKITASQAGNTTYAAATPVPQSFTVAKQPQTITFGAIANQGPGVTIHLSATASSGLPVSFGSTTPTTCSVAGNTTSGFTATTLAVGNCGIWASQAGNAVYAAATGVSQIFHVGQLAQTITFAPLPNVLATAPPFTVSATASSGLPVSFTSNSPTVCTVAGTTVTLVSGGPCTIKATQAGNAFYAVATWVAQSFTVTKASQTITFGLIASQRVGATINLSATASSGLPVTFAPTTPATCSVSGNTTSGFTATMLAVGNCGIFASQAGNGIFAAATGVSVIFSVKP
jgi:FtsP/CotA-like multicopper oxidase with cupredoxin domain